MARADYWDDIGLGGAIRTPPGRAKAATSRHNEPDEEPPFAAPNVVPLRPPESARTQKDDAKPERLVKTELDAADALLRRALGPAIDGMFSHERLKVGPVALLVREFGGELVEIILTDLARAPRHTAIKTMGLWVQKVREAAPSYLAGPGPDQQPRGAPPPRYGRKPTQAEIRAENEATFARVLERRLRNRARTNGDTGGFE